MSLIKLLLDLMLCVIYQQQYEVLHTNLILSVCSGLLYYQTFTRHPPPS
jgi:hypothetical protein